MNRNHIKGSVRTGDSGDTSQPCSSRMIRRRRPDRRRSGREPALNSSMPSKSSKHSNSLDRRGHVPSRDLEHFSGASGPAQLGFARCRTVRGPQVDRRRVTGQSCGSQADISRSLAVERVTHLFFCRCDNNARTEQTPLCCANSTAIDRYAVGRVSWPEAPLHRKKGRTGGRRPAQP